MEFKGTKTPWIVDGNLVFTNDYFQTHICEISESFDKETREANAQLIACAPELLSILSRIVEHEDKITYLKAGTGTIFAHAMTMHELYKEAKIVINKALEKEDENV